MGKSLEPAPRTFRSSYCYPPSSPLQTRRPSKTDPELGKASSVRSCNDIGSEGDFQKADDLYRQAACDALKHEHLAAELGSNLLQLLCLKYRVVVTDQHYCHSDCRFCFDYYDHIKKYHAIDSLWLSLFRGAHLAGSKPMSATCCLSDFEFDYRYDSRASRFQAMLPSQVR